MDESGNTYYYNEETGESSWEHPLDNYFKGLYERHKQSPVGSGPSAAEAAQMAQEQRLGHMQAAAGDSRPAMRYGGSSSTSVLLHRGNSEDLTASLPPKGATVHSLGGGRVDMSLVERMEAERARATTEGGQVRQMRYEGSQSESVLSNAMARATLGTSAGAALPGPAPGGGGLKAIGSTGHLSMDESALLGYGSNGTMVFKGSWDGTPCAVKRMHIAFVEMVDAEMQVLLDLGADWHPNLLRYQGKDQDENFVYLASDLCATTLHTMVEKPSFNPFLPDYSVSDETMQMLREVATGIEFLHSLGVVHCDIKPRNILLTADNQVKVSDMGLSKKLEEEETSFTFSTNAPSGDGGWAPSEVLLCKRKTMKVDIFAMGVLNYFVLSKGSHPFGNRFKRNGNIVDGVFELDKVKHLPDAYHLIASMINYDPEKRPTAAQVLSHPFFWSTEKKLAVLAETLAQAEDPAAHPETAERLRTLQVIGGVGWRRRVSAALIRHLEATQPMPAGAVAASAEDGGGWRYDDNKLIDLLRVLCATATLLAAGGEGLGDHLYVLTPADCTGTGELTPSS